MTVMGDKTFIYSILPLIIINSIFIIGFFIFFIFFHPYRRHKDLENRVITNKFFAVFQNYWFSITEPILYIFIKFKITPNSITYFGFLLSILAGYFYSEQKWGLAGWTLISSGLFDLFDGRLARATNQVSKKGAYLDAVMDRYSDGIILGGLALAFKEHHLMFYFIIISYIGFYTFSYTKARAEAFGVTCNVGYFQRPIRIILLGITSIITPILNYLYSVKFANIFYVLIAILGIGTILSSIYRIYYTYKKL
jgi:CDP-diacylglycerol---glycerol-3-phosphate 3-phosphatidyltransferase